METKDMTLICKDCEEEFIFTARDQEFYAEKGFTNPLRCKPCRDKRKAERNNRSNANRDNNNRNNNNVVDFSSYVSNWDEDKAA